MNIIFHEEDTAGLEEYLNSLALIKVDAVIVSDYFDVSMDNLFNKKALNSEQVLQIAKRYFENDKISLEEKKETLKRIFYLKNEREAKEII